MIQLFTIVDIKVTYIIKNQIENLSPCFIYSYPQFKNSQQTDFLRITFFFAGFYCTDQTEKGKGLKPCQYVRPSALDTTGHVHTYLRKIRQTLHNEGFVECQKVQQGTQIFRTSKSCFSLVLACADTCTSQQKKLLPSTSCDALCPATMPFN